MRVSVPAAPVAEDRVGGMVHRDGVLAGVAPADVMVLAVMAVVPSGPVTEDPPGRSQIGLFRR